MATKKQIVEDIRKQYGNLITTTHGIEIPVHVQTDELDLAISKAKKLSEILMEAKTLAREIASIDAGLKLDI